MESWCYYVYFIIDKPPFETNNVKETYKRIKMGNYSFPENEVISEPAKDLIRKLFLIEILIKHLLLMKKIMELISLMELINGLILKEMK